MTGSKRTIIISHGHLYLFWSTGVYYTSELTKKYQVILVVPEEYQEDPRFIDICEKMNVEEVVYFKDSVYFARQGYFGNHKTNVITRQLNYSKLFKDLINRCEPICVLQHDYIGIDNMYLFHWAKKLGKGCKRIVILSSQPSNEKIMEGFKVFRANNIKRLANRLHVPTLFVSMVVTSYKYVQSLLQNIIVPTIITSEMPYFPVSHFSNIDIVPNKKLFDDFLVYDKCEKNYLEKLLNRNNPDEKHSIQIIESPVIDRHNINDSLYGVKEQDAVLILPSLIALRGFKEEEETINKWVTALNLIKEQFPNYKFLIKFHPSNTSDDLKVLKTYLHEECKFLVFLDRKNRAEELILKSKIIVGDASTTLWWANLKGNKVVISLNMKDYPVSDNMKRYSKILCIDDMKTIANIDLVRFLEKARKDRKILIKAPPNLVSFIN